jgi:hypothetical protein
MPTAVRADAAARTRTLADDVQLATDVPTVSPGEMTKAMKGLLSIEHWRSRSGKPLLASPQFVEPADLAIAGGDTHMEVWKPGPSQTRDRDTKRK